MDLNTLKLSDTIYTPIPKFTLFGNLPIELRLKIITHALPPYSTIKVTPHIHVADPEFGLYVSFTPTNSEANRQTRNRRNRDALKPWYTEARSLNTLLVNQEYNTCYTENFPCSLPTYVHSTDRLPGYGRIRFSPLEVVYIEKFSNLHANPVVTRAIMERWNMQKLWKEIEQMACNMDGYDMLGCIGILKSFSSLKIVKLTLDKFYEDRKEMVKIRATKMQNKLQSWKEENGEHDYVVPTFELVGPENYS